MYFWKSRASSKNQIFAAGAFSCYFCAPQPSSCVWRAISSHNKAIPIFYQTTQNNTTTNVRKSRRWGGKIKNHHTISHKPKVKISHPTSSRRATRDEERSQPRQPPPHLPRESEGFFVCDSGPDGQVRAGRCRRDRLRAGHRLWVGS